MSLPDLSAGAHAVIARADLQQLVDALRQDGYQVVGPTVRDGAIVYDELRAVEDLPVGWTDEQDGGVYRLKRRADQALFGYAVGPHSWKQFLHPPVATLWEALRVDGGFRVVEPPQPAPKYAFVGVRACELAAIAIQDQVFLKGPVVDPGYAARREHALLIAVNCGTAAGTCFCVSMQTGPKAGGGYDLALTELLDDGRHEFTVHAGTERGAAILRHVRHQPAEPGHLAQAEAVVEQTASRMGRSMETAGIKELLYRNLEHARWNDVANRCLSCANCTMVCPTCFCTSVEDVTDLRGERAQRVRRWDSCFTLGFSGVHGGSVRASIKSRYRQWMTHKLATWIDQFGGSGCVGCGRCIAWCPVGIDLTQEVRAIRESERAQQTAAPTQEGGHADANA